MGIPSVIGPIIGPLLGGLITTYSHWRGIFWINVPVGVLGFFLAGKYIENMREDEIKPFDGTGFALTGFGLAATVFGLDTAFAKNNPDALGLGLLAAGLMALAVYVVYARRVSNPIIDLSLMRLPTFRASVTGGSVFRIGVGAIPFLLPLLMQEGFGYSPVESGAITFLSAAGSLGMRTLSKSVLRRFGYRPVLIWNGIVASFLMGICALFDADMPLWIMMAIIFWGGVSRSLEFTALNSLAFADVERAEMSHAMSFSQLAQRLSLTMGVAFSAIILHQVAGEVSPLPVSAFSLAFAVIGLVSATSVFSFMALAADAGAVLAGRKEQPK
jgi:MFS family permease